MTPVRRAPRHLTLAACLATVLATACEIAGTAAPDVEQRAVVHAVLNPATPVQTIIVERSLRSVTSGDTTRPYEPITNARVVIYGPRDDSAVAAAPTSGDPGRYRVSSVTVTDGSAGNAGPNVLRLRPGERYRLRVETPLGVVTGATTIPVSTQVDAARRTINVDRDTLRFNADAVRNAAGYLIRIETRFNVEERFRATVDPTLFLPLAQVKGDPNAVTWAFAFARGLMLPGLPQNFVVVAVDSNYFRYYAAGSDPFGDDTRGNSLTGGVGMFGSVSAIVSKTVDLTADIDTPIEGLWIADRSSATMPFTMTLYSSPFFPGTSTSGDIQVSGNSRLANGRSLDAIGGMNNGSAGIGIRFIDPTGSSGDADASGLLTGNTLVLTDARTGERVTYAKR